MRLDEGHRLTDEQLQELEERIREMYDEAAKELQDIIDDYFAKFAARDKEMQDMLQAGKIDEEAYKQWRLNQIGRGRRFENLRDKLAERATHANEVAVAYINDATPGIYTLNRNYADYEIESVGAGIDFTLYDEATIRRLLVERPDLMPEYNPYFPKSLGLKTPRDLEYGKKQITARVTRGILMGESNQQIAAGLRERLTNMSVTSAIRAARTAVTAAENGGRTASYQQAEEMGIELKREWLSTRDGRTRPEHGKADGQSVGAKEPFTVGGEKLMFPGDASLGASGWNLYCCRCAVKAKIKGHERKRELYSEWLERKKAEDAAETAELAELLKLSQADARDDLTKVIKRGTVKLKNGFSAFPDNDPLGKYVKRVKTLKSFFDVALHGSPTAVGFGTTETNMSPRLLASLIRHSEGWNGQKIRLLSCSTGASNGDDYCFAEELANALGVEVKAPNDLLYINESGKLSVGFTGQGMFVTYKPNQRRRTK